MNDFINSVMNNDFVNTATSYVTDSFMSIFILGVLTGWLIEWIFYNLFWKQRGDKDITDNNKEEAQSSAKIVEDNKESEKEQQPEKTDEVEKKQDVKQADQQEAKSKDDFTESEVEKSEEKQVDKQEAERQTAEEADQQEAKSKVESTESEVEKSEAKQPEKQDAEADKQIAEESKKDQAAESKDEAVEPKAEVAEKEASQKAAEKPAKKEKKASKPAKADDFTKLYGVGPSIAKSLKAIGIDSFKQLSESNSDELVEKLIANGTKVVNKGAMKSWAEQAKLADADDFDGLKALQNELKKG